MTKRIGCSYPERMNQPSLAPVESRRGALLCLATVAGAAVALPVVLKALSQSSFIQIKEALAGINVDTKAMIADTDGLFDPRIKDALNQLNSIEGKKRNDLFVDGLALVNQLGFKFRITTLKATPAPAYRIDWESKVIEVNRDWLTPSRPEVAELPRVLSVIGAAFVLLKVQQPSGPPPADTATLAESPQNNPERSYQEIAKRTAPYFVSLLVAETMLKSSEEDDLHVWHRLNDEFLDPRNSFLQLFISGNRTQIFGDGKIDFSFSQGLTPQLIEETRRLIKSLDLNDRGVGRRHSF